MSDKKYTSDNYWYIKRLNELAEWDFRHPVKLTLSDCNAIKIAALLIENLDHIAHGQQDDLKAASELMNTAFEQFMAVFNCPRVTRKSIALVADVYQTLVKAHKIIDTDAYNA